MRSFFAAMASGERRTRPLAVHVRNALGIALLGSVFTTSPVAAQQTLGTVVVTASTGTWYGFWDTYALSWEWQFDAGDVGGGTVDSGPPPSSELCDDLEEQWENSDCPSQTAISTNGCGPSGILSWAVPEAPVPDANFTGACNNHDVCYSTLGVSRSVCDTNLGADAADACAAAAPVFRSQGVDLGLLGQQLQNYVQNEVYECQGFATAYQGAVMAFGASPFHTAQTTAHCRAMRELSNANGCGL